MFHCITNNSKCDIDKKNTMENQLILNEFMLNESVFTANKFDIIELKCINSNIVNLQ